MKKLKGFFVNIFSTFESIFILIILIFGYPFYRKSLKEIWGMIKKAREERNKYLLSAESFIQNIEFSYQNKYNTDN